MGGRGGGKKELIRGSNIEHQADQSELQTQQSEKDLMAIKVHCMCLKGMKYFASTQIFPLR